MLTVMAGGMFYMPPAFFVAVITSAFKWVNTHFVMAFPHQVRDKFRMASRSGFPLEACPE
jgi:hypothetical protein